MVEPLNAETELRTSRGTDTQTHLTPGGGGTVG